MTTFQITWIALAALLLIACLLIGIWINGRPLGVLIDGRGKMSLSRLQLVLWNWLLISSFLALAVTFVSMNIEMTPQLWALMGISVGSAAGSVIVKGTKASQQPAPTVSEGAMSVSHRGLLTINTDVRQAQLTDLFSGEELTDCGSVDISKVQMFFFTMAAVVGYAIVLWAFPFRLCDGKFQFPEISSSLVTLLGISHAGYLTIKAAPKTPAA